MQPKVIAAPPQRTFHQQRKQPRVDEEVVLDAGTAGVDKMALSTPVLGRRSLLAALPALAAIGSATGAPPCPMHVSAMPPQFFGCAHAVFGFGVAGVDAAKAAAAACYALRSHEDPRWMTAMGGMQCGTDAADAVLAADWSFSILCCDAADDRAMSQADAAARDLSRRGHMPVLLAAGTPPALLASSTEAADGKYQSARLLLSAPNHPGGLVPVLAASATALLSSIVCQGLVSLDATDIWSAIGGPSPGLVIQAVAGRGQSPIAFGQSVVSAARAAGVRQPSVRRLLLVVLMPSAWRLHELDALATAIVERFGNAEIVVMSVVDDPTASTASVLLLCS
jgi:hypothetical protein